MRFCTTLLICLLFLSAATGQDNPTDSLRKVLQGTESDTGRVNILIDIVYAQTHTDSALVYAKQAHEIGRKTSSVRHQSRSELVLGSYLAELDFDSAISLMNSGIRRYIENDMPYYSSNAIYITALTYQSNNKLDSALLLFEKNYEIATENQLYGDAGEAAISMASILSARGRTVQALKWAQRARDEFNKGQLLQEQGQAMNQIGIIYDQKGLYSEAIEQYLQARELAIASDDIEGEILISNNLGVIYDNMGNSEKSMNYYSDALEKARIHNLPADEATILNNLSYIHASRGDTSKAIELLKKSLRVNLSEYYPCFESYPLEGLASIHLNRKQLDSAAYYLKKGLRIAERCEDAVVIATLKKDFGQLYTRQKKFELANKNLDEALALAKRFELQLEKKEALKAYYQSLKAQGKPKLALSYLEEYQNYSDSLIKLKNTERAFEIAAEYEFRKEISKIEEEQRLAEEGFTEKLESQSNLNKLILLALILFVMLSLTMVFAYRSIRKRNAKLRWLNGEKNKLMGIVAHDLRNPLNMIVGLIPLFKGVAEEVKREDLNQYVGLMEATSDKMKNMIERVLDISSIENMKVNLQLRTKDLSEVISNCSNNFKMIAENKEISIEKDLDGKSKFLAKVDANYLEQVLDNLLSNAIKFSDRGKKIRLKLESSDRHHIILVTDEGPGIAAEEQVRIFKPYTTVSSKPTDNERSSGLGLSIVQKFVQAMDGEITCESEVGHGTTFRISFAKA